MRAAIYNPYFDILGGGERYILTIAYCLSKKHQVDILWQDKSLKEKAQEKFNLNLEGVRFVSFPENFFKRVSLLKKYDLFLYVTDGSLFFSPARKSFLIIQSPAHIPSLTFLNRMKLLSWQKIICYSQFMARIIKKKLAFSKPEVLFVPVGLNDFFAGKKENIIFSVGRFFPFLHNKKQKELVRIFKKITNKLPGWKLVLAGSVDRGGEKYLKEVKREAKDLQVEIFTDLPFSELRKFYSKAKIYWHGTGFSEDLELHPERAEHFGVSTVEAQASGCTPIVFAGGGQKEIVVHGRDGFLWKNERELINYTLRIANDESLREKMSRLAIKRSRDFSKEKFCQQIDKLVNS